MTNLENLGNIQLYEDDWNYCSGMDMEVSSGKVSVYEHNIDIRTDIYADVRFPHSMPLFG